MKNIRCGTSAFTRCHGRPTSSRASARPRFASASPCPTSSSRPHLDEAGATSTSTHPTVCGSTSRVDWRTKPSLSSASTEKHRTKRAALGRASQTAGFSESEADIWGRCTKTSGPAPVPSWPTAITSRSIPSAAGGRTTAAETVVINRSGTPFCSRSRRRNKAWTSTRRSRPNSRSPSWPRYPQRRRVISGAHVRLESRCPLYGDASVRCPRRNRRAERLTPVFRTAHSGGSSRAPVPAKKTGDGS